MDEIEWMNVTLSQQDLKLLIQARVEKLLHERQTVQHMGAVGDRPNELAASATGP